MLARRGKGKINLAVSGFSDGVLAAGWAGRAGFSVSARTMVAGRIGRYVPLP